VDIFGWPLGAHAGEHSALLGVVPQALYQEIGRSEEGLEQLKAISPSSTPTRSASPCCVLQGRTTRGVIKPIDDIVAEVRKHGVPVEYVVFPDEGHGFTQEGE